MSLRTEQVTKEIAPFTLKLPDVFDPKPAHEIELPAGRKALVYATTVPVNERGEYVVKHGWRVVVMTKRGTFANAQFGNRNSCYSGTTFVDPLLLSLFVQGLAIQYAKQKKTTVTENDQDDD